MNSSSTHLQRSCHLGIFLVCLLLTPLSLLASKQQPIIGLCLDSLVLDRWQQDRDTFVAAAEKLGARVLVCNADSDDVTQIANIRSLVAKGVDAIVVVPHRADALAEAIKAANAAKIPVISYDRLILNADISCYLSFDNIKVGEAQASYVAARLPAGRKARIVRLYGSPSDNNAKMFKQGQDKILDPLISDGKVEVIFEGWAVDWKESEGLRLMNQAISKEGLNFDAVLASNDTLAGAAIQTIAAAGSTPPGLIVTGQDADKSACVRIKNGTQSMTVYKPLHKLAVRAAQVAVDLAKGNALETSGSIDNNFKAVPAVFESIISVDKNNLASTVIADGFHRKR